MGTSRVKLGRKPKLTPADELLILELYDEMKGIPLTLLQLAEKFEVSIETIRRCLKKHGAKPVTGIREDM
jgi:hypothetical protein